MPTPRTNPFVPAALALCVTSAAFAQADDAQDVTISFTPSGTYTTESSLDGEPGDFSLATAGFDLSFTFSPADDLTLVATLAHETAYYDFSGATTLVPGTDSPIDLAYDSSISLTSIIKHDNNISFLVTGGLNNAFARGADFNDAFTYHLAAGVSIKVSPTLSLTLGGGFRTRLENNTIGIPLIQLDWKIDDQTRLTARGFSLKLARDVDDANTIHIRSAFELREYRLDEDTPTIRDGSFEHTRIPLAIGWTHAPDDNFSITAEVGAILWQEIEVRTGSGDRVTEFDADPSLFLALTANFRF